MKRETVLTLSTAVLAVVFGMTNNAQAKTPKSASSTPVPASADLQADAARMNAFIEERAREMPEQYYWLHKRFKTRPAGEPSPYA